MGNQISKEEDWEFKMIEVVPQATLRVDINKQDPAWSVDIAKRFGDLAAVSFVIGSNQLLVYLDMDLDIWQKPDNASLVSELDEMFAASMRPNAMQICIPQSF